MLRPSCKAVGITRSLTRSGFLDVTQRCFWGTLCDIQKTAASETPVIPTALQDCFLTYTRYTEFFKRAASSFCNLGF